MWVQQLRNLLRTDVRTQHLHIDVEQTDGTIRLTGSTHSFYQKQVAQEAVLAFIRAHALSLENAIAVSDNGFTSQPPVV